MFSRRETLLLAVLFGGLLLASLVLAPFEAARNPADARLTTLRSTPNGARALFLTLEELGLPVSVARRSFAVDSLPDGPLAILAPSRAPIPEEIGVLMEWLRAGGQLLYVPPIIGGGSRDGGILDSLGLRADRPAGRGGLGAEADIPAVPTSHRWILEGTGSLPPARTGVYPEDDRGLPPVVPVIASDSLLILLEAGVGDGRAVVWTTPEWLRNESLGENDAPAVILARIVSELTGGTRPLHFDEYHHGFQEGGGPLRSSLRFFRSTPLGRGTLHLAAVGLLALLFAGVRFGTPDPPPSRERRSPMEHIQALAGLYRRSQARDRLAFLLLVGLGRRLGYRAPPEDPDQTDPWIARLPIAEAHRRDIANAWQERGPDRLSRLADAIDQSLAEGSMT